MRGGIDQKGRRGGMGYDEGRGGLERVVIDVFNQRAEGQTSSDPTTCWTSASHRCLALTLWKGSRAGREGGGGDGKRAV